MKYRLDQSVSFFLIVFVFWLAGGVIMAEIRDSSFCEEVLGFKVEYKNIYNVFYQYIIFIIVFVVSALLINGNHKRYLSKFIEVQLAIVLAVITILVKISQYGFVLFSGDYYSRFNVDANLLVNILPTVFVIVAIEFLSRNKIKSINISNRYLFVIIGVSVLSVLAGSRSTPFYALIAALSYYYISSGQGGNANIYNSRIAVKKVMLYLFVIYAFGQLANILRWFSTDATLQDSIIAILGDSFPEYRSHSQVEANMSESQIESYSFLLWLQNLSAYIFPGFVFEVFGASRSQVFNQVWTDFFQPIIWGDKEALYGIRTGLVGEISLALGDLYLVFFAVFFAYLLQKNKSKVITVTCLVGAIPYGATSIFILFYCLLFQFVVKLIAGIIQIKYQ